jgi:hypothetical protein
MATTPREHAAHLERTSVLAMLCYSVFLAAFFFALAHTSGPRAVSPTAMTSAFPELTTDETIGYQ